MTTTNKIAILIDGDNAQSALIEQYVLQAEKFGKVTVRRIYADWTDNKMKNWKNQVNKFAVKPIQKFAYTTAKNSTDTALIIDAMDLLHSKRIDGICIVSSDSDYTGLANRIREEGLFVMGIGKSHTPEAFVKSCENFTFSETLQPTEITPTREIKEPIKNAGVQSIDLKEIERAFQMVANSDTGQALLSRLPDALRKVNPTFNFRNFGYNSFRSFCNALKPHYETVLHEDKATFSLKKYANNDVIPSKKGS